MVTSVCVQYLGLEEEAAESLIVNMVSGEDMWGFMEEILQSLEFGTVESEQMVALRGNVGEIFSGNFIIKCSYFPETGRYPVLWPALWIRTGWRFARNNRVVRRTTIKKVIQNAKKRGKISNKLHLFER